MVFADETNTCGDPMRILLTAMFMAPIAGYVAYQSGAANITPFMISMALIAIAAQILLERRERRS